MSSSSNGHCGASAVLKAPTSLHKPDWLRVRLRYDSEAERLAELVRDQKLVTVCQEAACPNINECWSKKHATFMILGSVCTRGCRFCNVATGKPDALDHDEPRRVAEAVKTLGLRHVVITSVDRDDLEDGGAQHFEHVIASVRRLNPNTTIEILTPDFLRKNTAPDIIVRAKPDVFNHNVETVPRLYRAVRPGARYFHSLQLLQTIKYKEPTIFTKSGLMVGLGESDDEVYQVMDDMRAANVDFLTIGQYLQPTPDHYPVAAYIEPKRFEGYEQVARHKGFLMVSASPFTRSSYHADDDFIRLKQAAYSSSSL